MIPGRSLDLGGRSWVVPPINFAALKKHRAFIAEMRTGSVDLTDAQQDAMLDLIYLALRRNYPDITPEQVEDMIDLANMQPVFAAIMSVSGFEAAAAGECRPGEM